MSDYWFEIDVDVDVLIRVRSVARNDDATVDMLTQKNNIKIEFFDWSRAWLSNRELCQVVKILTNFQLLLLHNLITTSILTRFE